MSLLVCQGVTRRPFFERRDLVLDPGEILVLQGPTGSGKTLFLRAVADLDPADGGRFALQGTDRSSMNAAAWRRRVLYVHQSAPRLPGTVGENLDRIASLGRGGASSAAPLPPLDHGKDADRLSGGEAQLLALHRALSVEPRVLLLDESTSALDPEHARRVEEVLREWSTGERAIVWVSHEESLAERVGARVEVFP